MKTDFLKPCDIMLYKGDGLTSHLIQWKTNSPYSHVAVIVHPKMCLGIESNTGHQDGVRAFDLRKLEEKKTDVFRVKSNFQFDCDRAISFLVDHLGARYDYAGIVWLSTLKLFGMKAKSNQFQKEKDYFCSELCYQAFKEAGLDIVPEVDEADITSPADISLSSVLEKAPVPSN